MNTKEYAQFVEGDRVIVVKRSANPVEARISIEGFGYVELGVPAARELRQALMAFLDDCWEHPPALELTTAQWDALRLLAQEGELQYEWYDTKTWRGRRLAAPGYIRWSDPLTVDPGMEATMKELARLSLVRDILHQPWINWWVLTKWGQQALKKAGVEVQP